MEQVMYEHPVHVTKTFYDDGTFEATFNVSSYAKDDGKIDLELLRTMYGQKTSGNRVHDRKNIFESFNEKNKFETDTEFIYYFHEYKTREHDIVIDVEGYDKTQFSDDYEYEYDYDYENEEDLEEKIVQTEENCIFCEKHTDECLCSFEEEY